MSQQTVSRPLALLALIGVLVLSFLPVEMVDPLRLKIGDSTEIGHGLAYAFLTTATMLSVPRQALTVWLGIGVVLAISALGLGIELLQSLVGRTTSTVDFAQNEIGIAGGNALYLACLRIKPIRVKNKIPRPGGE
jgi:hypothetical protein